MVFWEGLKLAVPGLLLGFATAFAVSTVIAGMLVNVSPVDPATFAAATVFLGLVVLAATYIPARRATQVEPMEALRFE
jgi:ABC-type antimicrobial peptide transport system permease subunit